MSLWFAAVLGIVQGLTEFLPISSTAHLRIAPVLLGEPDAGAAFSAVIQLGTLLAVLVYFRRDLFIDMPRAVFGKGERSGASAFYRKLPLYLVAGTIPIAITGLSLKDYIVGDFRSLYVVGGALVALGVVMWLVERRYGDDESRRGQTTLSWLDVMLIGGAQTLALIPGISRSGSTIVAALILGLRRDDAARFSFLLGVPAIGAAGLFELKDAAAQIQGDALGPIVVGTVASAVSGYICIAWLLRYLKRNSLVPFALYRIAIGAALITAAAAGLIEAVS